MNILSVKHIQKKFKNINAVQDVSFELNEGDVFGFIGPNGSGKTTTIRMLLGLLDMDQGDISINGFSIKNDFYKAIAKVGALVEGPAFYEYMNGEENLECFAAYSGGVSKEKIMSLLKLVGLEGREKDKVKNYSLGMKQRLGIAQALLNDPKVLILDEPTNGLDPQGIKDIREIIKILSKKGVTIFISSHMLSEIQNICNKILIIKDGIQIICKPTAELISRNKMYDIWATDNNHLIKVLKSIEGVDIRECKDKIKVELQDKLLPEDLLQELVKNQVKIRIYNPNEMSLEDYFFSATGGTTHDIY